MGSRRSSFLSRLFVAAMVGSMPTADRAEMSEMVGPINLSGPEPDADQQSPEGAPVVDAPDLPLWGEAPKEDLGALEGGTSGDFGTVQPPDLPMWGEDSTDDDSGEEYAEWDLDEGLPLHGEDVDKVDAPPPGQDDLFEPPDSV